MDLTSHHHLILIADDDEDDRYFINLSFCELGWSQQIKILEGGQGLKNYLNKLDSTSYPALILLDYNMPGMNGEQVLNYLKSQEAYRSIPVVIYSIEMTQQMSDRLIGKGALACYKKSLTSTQSLQLAQTLKNMAQYVAA